MENTKIWDKILSEGEKIEFEFSISKRYRKIFLIVWVAIGLISLMAGVGIFIIAWALFYYGFYLKISNAYAFTNKRVLVHRGWLSTNMVSIDYPKITDITVIEPFFDRLITHTGNILINTAGTATVEAALRHIELPYEIKKKLDALKG